MTNYFRLDTTSFRRTRSYVGASWAKLCGSALNWVSTDVMSLSK